MKPTVCTDPQVAEAASLEAGDDPSGTLAREESLAQAAAASYREALLRIGVPEQIVDDLLDESNPTRHAQASFISQHLHNIDKHAKSDADWRASQWLLQVRFPTLFGDATRIENEERLFRALCNIVVRLLEVCIVGEEQRESFKLHWNALLEVFADVGLHKLTKLPRSELLRQVRVKLNQAGYYPD